MLREGGRVYSISAVTSRRFSSFARLAAAARQRAPLLRLRIAQDAAERDGPARLEHESRLRSGVLDRAVATDARIEGPQRQLDAPVAQDAGARLEAGIGGDVARGLGPHGSGGPGLDLARRDRHGGARGDPAGLPVEDAERSGERPAALDLALVHVHRDARAFARPDDVADAYGARVRAPRHARALRRQLPGVARFVAEHHAAGAHVERHEQRERALHRLLRSRQHERVGAAVGHDVPLSGHGRLRQRQHLLRRAVANLVDAHHLGGRRQREPERDAGQERETRRIHAHPPIVSRQGRGRAGIGPVFLQPRDLSARGEHRVARRRRAGRRKRRRPKESKVWPASPQAPLRAARRSRAEIGSG